MTEKEANKVSIAIKEQLDNCNENLTKELRILLSKYEYNPINILRTCVASLLNVNEIDLLTNSQKIQLSQARWFFWLAYRRMTNDPYEKMAQMLSIEGHHFHTQSIVNSVSRMNRIIVQDKTWGKKWEKMKEIIKIIQNGRY